MPGSGSIGPSRRFSGPTTPRTGFWYDSAGQMEQAVLFYLPREMEFVLLVNSPVASPPEFLYSLVADAYTNNIVAAHMSILPGT
jgi:hypothetical protein